MGSALRSAGRRRVRGRAEEVHPSASARPASAQERQYDEEDGDHQSAPSGADGVVQLGRGLHPRSIPAASTNSLIRRRGAAVPTAYHG